MRRFSIPFALGIFVFLFAGFFPEFSMVSPVFAASLAVQVVNTTDTQAVLSYTAPDNNPCTVQVSENPSLTPLVHDVDPNLFPGSNMDNRPEAVSNGTKRIFVVGKRTAEKAPDGNFYSRALQTYTTHYYNITCGASVANGSFTTANIPLGMTYNDAPPPDPSNPGGWMVPTQKQDRTQTIVDPQTGALLKRVSLDAEASHAYGAGGVSTGDSGFGRDCANKLQTAPDGTQGYLCIFFLYNQGYGELYYIVPATGEARDLGMVSHPYPSIDDDMNVYAGDSQGNIYRYTYTGDFSSQSYATFSSGVLYSSVSAGTLMQQFDPSIDLTLFNCYGGYAAAGEYSLITCARGIQNSYGWLGVFYGGDGRTVAPNCNAGNACPRVVAAMNVMAAPETRWCTLHEQGMVPDNPLVWINLQENNNFDSTQWENGYFGTAPMATTLAANVAAGDTSITVVGQPASLDTNDTFRQNVAVGDIFYIGQNRSDVVTITGITTQSNGQVTWQVSRSSPQQSFPAGTLLWAGCKAGFNFTYWKFLNDAHGSDTSNTNVVVDQYWSGGGHDDDGPLGRVTESASGEGWDAVFGTIINNLNQPLSLHITDTPSFAGALGLDYGNTTAKHPSYQQDVNQTTVAQQQWFLDMLPFDGGNLYSGNPGVTPVSGQLYKYIIGVGGVARKQLATLASNGGLSLLDVSGPNSAISDQPSDSYHYCVANLPGECRPGSAAGDIYINTPTLQYQYCTGGDGPNPLVLDACFGNIGTYAQGITQLYLGANNADATAHSRVLTHALAGMKDMFYYTTAKSLPNASWALFNTGVVFAGQLSNVWMVKLTPLVAQDNIDRSTFVRAPITITPPAGQGIAQAAVEFGYTEQGTASQHYCTSRRESCLATTATVTDSNPFNYEQTDSYSLMPCTTSCTITLPVLPMHVAYYQVKYYNSSGALIANGDYGVAAEATVADINNLSVAAQDTTPPTAVISSPAQNATLTGNATISVSASDNVGVSRVELYIDGSLKSTDTTAPYSFSIDTTTLANGSHTLSAKAYDASGNIGTSPSVQVTVTNQAGTVPTISSFSASPATINSGQSSVLSWTVSGATSLTLDNSVGSVTNLTSKTVSPAQTATYTLTAMNAQGTSNAQTTVTVAGTLACPGPATNSFTGCYYMDQTLTTLGLVRTDPSINFNWNNGGSPGSPIPAYGFSARWNGNFTFPAGNTTFTTVTDDGTRLYVDGTKVIDDWTLQAATTETATVNLTAGTHLITMEYFQNSGQASAQLSWTTQSLNPDTTAPTASLTSPSAGTVSGTVTLSATASDPVVSGQVTSGLFSLVASLDGAVYASSTTGSISVPLDTTTLSNGSHAITVTAKDNAGNAFTTSPVTITVNNVSGQKYPRLITLSSLEGLSALPTNEPITVIVLSTANGSVLETQSNLVPNASKQYTISFLSSDPQLVNIRVKASGYLSQLLSNVDTTVNTLSALSVPQLSAGDLNNDNAVNSLDYSLINSHWLQNFPSADINGDGLINSLDFAILKNDFGKSGL